MGTSLPQAHGPVDTPQAHGPVETPLAPRSGRARIERMANGAARILVIASIVSALGLLAGCSSGSRTNTSSGARGGTYGSTQIPPPSPVGVSGSCVGAAALASVGGCPRTTSEPVTPNPAAAAKDRPDAYSTAKHRTRCIGYPPDFPVATCDFGDVTAPTRIALIGNSHAAQWLPAIEQIAVRQHWRVTTYLSSQCALADVAQHFDTPAQTRLCQDWAARTTAAVAGQHFDLVVMSDKISRGAVGHDLLTSLPLFQRGYTTVLQALHAAHQKVVGIRDTPSPGFQVPACLAAHPDDFAPCDGTRATWLPAEPMTRAVQSIGDRHITSIDMTDYICEPSTCPAAVGGVPVYFDVSHLTATYARTLAPYLEPKLVAALKAP